MTESDIVESSIAEPAEAAICFDRVTLAMAGRTVLSYADFTIEPGEFIGVLGPNGAGKTTLMRAILGLVPPVTGRIRVQGMAPARGNPGIGYMPQLRQGTNFMGLNGAALVR